MRPDRAPEEPWSQHCVLIGNYYSRQTLRRVNSRPNNYFLLWIPFFFFLMLCVLNPIFLPTFLLTAAKVNLVQPVSPQVSRTLCSEGNGVNPLRAAGPSIWLSPLSGAGPGERKDLGGHEVKQNMLGQDPGRVGERTFVSLFHLILGRFLIKGLF